MNNNDIKKILDDLYALDPTLRSHEKSLITLISAMAIKPEAHYNPAFAANLRVQLLAELAKQRQAAQPTVYNFFRTPAFRYAILSIAIIALGAAAFIGLQPRTGGSVALNSSKITITNVGSNAFGTLSASNATGGNGATPTAASVPARAPGVAGPMNAVSQSAASPAVISPSQPAQPSVIAMPIGLTTVQYKYVGAPISQNQTQLNVLKKVVQPLEANQATAALEQKGLGPINLAAFNNLSMSNVTLSQNQPFGYQISIDFTDGTISIDQNYNEWPQNTATTTPLTASDIPSDAAVIATANQFLANYGISTANYGVPEVINSNNLVVPVATPAIGNAAAASPTSATANAIAMPMIPYYSDSEQVLYPLVVNGENVYDTGGNEIGITVEVNVRYNRVENAYGIETQSYQSSAYDAITNTSTILSLAESTLTYPRIYNFVDGSAGTGSSNVNNPVQNLGTPTMGYEDMYQIDSQGQSNEFLVPAFIFPVATSTSNPTARNIIIPLIQDFEQQDVNVTPPIPAPLNMNAASGGATASPVMQ